jgi:hypothetical protein
MTDEMNETIETNDGPVYPLARDVNGIPLAIPVEAVAWRVRKLAKRAGRPKLIFDSETGTPLELPLTASYDDLCDHVSDAGRYRLEAVDGHGRPIAGCVAVTEVFSDDEGEVLTLAPSADALPAALQLIAQLVQSNAKVMEAMASAFGQVQPAAPPSSAPVVVTAPSSSEKQQINPIEMFQQVMQFFNAGKLSAAPTNNPPSPASGVQA